jgi:type I restriction enzyme S subunit
VNSRLGDFFDQRQEPGESGLPVMSVTMNDSLVPRDGLDRRMESALRPEQHLLVRKGDIAYNMMRMWQGACGLATSDGMVSPAYVVLAPKSGVDSQFAYHWFKSDRMVHLFWAYSHGLTEDRLRLYFDEFVHIPASPPSLEQQRRIVAVLDVWDQAIVQTERLLAAKRRHKSGTLGRILLSSGEKRGFIRDVAAINPRNQRTADDTQVSFVAMEDVSENGELLAKTTFRRGDLGNGYTQFLEGDILVGKITPCFENGKGALAIGLTNGVGFGTTEFHVIRPHDPADADYLHQLTLTRSFRIAGERQMTGSAGQRRVPAEFIKDFPIFIMDSKARRSAGRLLATLDLELSGLGKTLLALRTQKRGLMQKLLAGQWRLDERFNPPDLASSVLTRSI